MIKEVFLPRIKYGVIHGTIHVKVGDQIRILEMLDEPHYRGRVGIVTEIDDAYQLHGTWGGLAVNPQVDTFEIVSRG